MNQNTAGVLDLVERGETVEITNCGKPIARIVPVAGGELDDLISAGVVTLPTISGPIPMPGADAGEVASAMRDEERW